jgi:hypothetical protein
MAVKTGENHKIRIYDKLGVRTQAHAVSLAISQGLLAGGELAALTSGRDAHSSTDLGAAGAG